MCIGYIYTWQGMGGRHSSYVKSEPNYLSSQQMSK